MQWSLSLAVVTLGVLSASAWADDKRDCLNHEDAGIRIKACSEIIRSDPSDAIAYHTRGKAHQLKGDLDRAIADYDKAIQLKPNYASAYETRGLVYATKGDYIHALADVTRASELSRETPFRRKAITKPHRKVRPIASAPAPANQMVFSDVPEAQPKWAPQHESPR
jgi:tetratricopeptide (TPR) repeat protein